MIYITYVDLYGPGYLGGITKKIMSQIKVFQRYFEKVYYTTWSGQMFYLMDGNQVIDKELAPTRAICQETLIAWLDKFKIQRTYIRYSLADKWLLKFLKAQKEKGIKTVLEIPTYPYDGEIENERLKIEDQYYRKLICQYVKYVATNSESKDLLGMSCIQLLNGVDIDENPLQFKKKSIKKIVLIGVSSMVIWHGYERVLEGLFNYYNDGGEYDFLFKIVGDGPESRKYHSLSFKYNLQSRVEFCGRLEGEELNKQYESADVAVSSLGFYKIGVHSVTPIKGAEYCARGIPFICGYHDMRFPKNAEYIMTVPNCMEPIDMYKVITFYENITSQNGYQKMMRDYALRNFTWESIMEPIVKILM